MTSDVDNYYTGLEQLEIFSDVEEAVQDWESKGSFLFLTE